MVQGAGSQAQSIGVTVSEITIDIRIAKVSVYENSRTNLPIMPGMNNKGMNTAIKERLIDTTVKAICLAPSRAAVHPAHPLFECGFDIFDHHDGVVDDKADGNRERHERKIVDGKSADP